MGACPAQAIALACGLSQASVPWPQGHGCSSAGRGLAPYIEGLFPVAVLRDPLYFGPLALCLSCPGGDVYTAGSVASAVCGCWPQPEQEPWHFHGFVVLVINGKCKCKFQIIKINFPQYKHNYKKKDNCGLIDLSIRKSKNTLFYMM